MTFSDYVRACNQLRRDDLASAADRIIDDEAAALLSLGNAPRTVHRRRAARTAAEESFAELCTSATSEPPTPRVILAYRPIRIATWALMSELRSEAARQGVTL